MTKWPRNVQLTDYGHPERAFLQKSETFGLGQTNWAENIGGIWGIFGQTTGIRTISTHFGTVTPCFPLFKHYF